MKELAWLAPALLACGCALLARRTLVVVTVIGTSMVPTFRPGDRVLVRRTSRVRRGQVVVARPPGFLSLVIKRIAAVAGNEVPAAVRPATTGSTVPQGTVVLIGDGDGSTDSREWGPIAVRDVVGVVVARLGGAA